MKKETKLIIIVVLVIILIGLLFIVFKSGILSNKEKNNLNENNVIKKEDINLNNYTTNINLTEGGEYNITGSFNYSLIINTTEKVILNLNNVTINSKVIAAIANINSGELIINLPKGTTNTLKDSGTNEYDGCIYSLGKLTIDGLGKLNVYGNQRDGEGITTKNKDITINDGEIYIESTDDGLNAGGTDGGVITINGGNIYINANGDGIDSNKDLIINGGTMYVMGSVKKGDSGIDTDGLFEINGGNIIILGYDMLENPKNSSKQKYMSFTLNLKIIKDSKISLKNSKGKEVFTFSADKDFRTLIVSNSNFKKGTYYLYINGEKTEYSSTIN